MEQKHALNDLLSQKNNQNTIDEESPELLQMRAKLLEEFSDVFPDSLPAGVPLGRGHELHIQLTPRAKPAARGASRINQKHATFESKWLKDMLDKDLISKSQSQFAAPHFYVDKPETPTSGEYRAVTDFRALNAVTVKKRYPLLRADQLFNKLSKAKVFYQDRLAHGVLPDSY